MAVAKKTLRKKKKVILSMPPVWSFSRWKTYELCPHKARLQYIDGYHFEDQRKNKTAADRGTDIHLMAEKIINAKGRLEIPPVFDHFREDIKRMRALKAVAEVKLGLKRDWTPCDFDDPDYWWHGAFDLVAMLKPDHAFIMDWKTGKIYEDHATQLELYAIVLFIYDEAIEKITVEDWYIDQKKKSKPVTYLRRQLPQLIKLWERRVSPMFNDRTFPPTANHLCGWCDFAKKTGNNLCEFGYE